MIAERLVADLAIARVVHVDRRGLPGPAGAGDQARTGGARRVLSTSWTTTIRVFRLLEIWPAVRQDRRRAMDRRHPNAEAGPIGRSVILGATLAVAMLVHGTGPVAADDTGAPASEGLLGNLDLGTCVGLGWRDGDVKSIIRTPAEPQFPDGAVLRLSVVPIAQASNANLSIDITDDEIVLPADWSTLPATGDAATSRPDSWRYDYVVTVTTEGTATGTVTWGISVNDGAVTQHQSRLTVAVSPPCPDAYPEAYATPPVSDTAPAAPTVADHDTSRPFLLLLLGAAALLILDRRFKGAGRD